MKNKRILSIIAAGVMTLSLLSGCGKKAEPAVATAPATVAETTAAVAETTAPAKAEATTPEVYKASSDFDERGWKGEVTVTYTDGKISKVEYMETNKAGVKKSEDKAYASMKVQPADAFAKLTEAALKEDKAITVSGATGISTTFKTLYEKAKAMKK